MAASADPAGPPADPWRVLVLAPVPADLAALFVPDDARLVLPAERTPAAARDAAADCDVVLGDWSATLPVDAALLAAAPHLSFVQQPSAGTDAVDLAAAAARGIPVANTGGANTVSVAEWCVAGAFAVLRSLLPADAAVRAGAWPQTELPIAELAGRTVGILGMGRIGAACASRFNALGCDVVYWNRTPLPAGQVAARYLPLADLLPVASVLVCVLPLAAETRGLLDAAALGALPAGAVVVNAGRGGVVDDAALAAALTSGALGGAAVDVYDREPIPAGHPLLAAPRVVLSPHAAGSSDAAKGRIFATCRANLTAAVSGQPVGDVVNGVSGLVRRRR